MTPGRSGWSVWWAIALYLAMCVGTVRGVGLVGEVIIGWALPSPPAVMLELDPAVGGDGEGALRVNRTRPNERVVVGGFEAPLAINGYTGGPPDWPARLARAVVAPLASQEAGITAGLCTNLVLGAVLLALSHRFLLFHGSRIAAAAAAFFLATDWCFIFYRKVLGGTEVLLQAAALLVLWALWSRRWKGGTHGTIAIALGVGLGLLAKATFVATLGAFGFALLVTRWDRPAIRAPRRVHPGVLLGLPLVLCSPLLVANLHAAYSDLPTLRSHDTLALQFGRLLTGWSHGAPSREGWSNLLYFFGDPLRFFADAYGAVPVAPISVLRLVGFVVTGLGALLVWRDRVAQPSSTPTPPSALLRLLSVFVPAQIGLLWFANRDLHHLAQATVPLALFVGLAAERAAAALAPPRSVQRAILTMVLVSPHLFAGALHLWDTDRVIATVTTPSFTERGQAELVAMLREHGVRELVCSDYEMYGMIEARAPEIAVTHTWGAVANGATGEAVLRSAIGRWYLAVRASAPMVYNWSPNARKVEVTAEKAALRAVPVADLGGPAAWATLYRVEAR